MRASENKQAWLEMLSLFDKKEKTKAEEQRLTNLRVLFFGVRNADPADNIAEYKTKIRNTEVEKAALELNCKLIKDYMEASGLSRKALSKKTGVGYEAIKGWLRKKALPRNEYVTMFFFKGTGIQLKNLKDVTDELNNIKGADLND